MAATLHISPGIRRGNGRHAKEEARVEARHEKTDVLDEHRDEAEHEAGGEGYASVGQYRQQGLGQAHQVHHHRPEDKPRQEHYCLEAAVTWGRGVG